jgi:hypothetical protein
MKKTFISVVSMSFIFTKADPPKYKNLKILPKDINKEQMDSVMRQFAGSLGVKCNHCHYYNQEQKSMDFASDAVKEKDIARNMMKLTAKINSKYFDVEHSKDLGAKLEVGCFTCHHGTKNPETKAPPPPPRQGAPGAAPQGARPAGADSTKH